MRGRNERIIYSDYSWDFSKSNARQRLIDPGSSEKKNVIYTKKFIPKCTRLVFRNHERREWRQTFTVLASKNTPTWNSISSELLFKSRESRTFSGGKKKRVSVCLKCMANIWHDSELLFSRWWLFVTINRKTQTIIFWVIMCQVLYYVLLYNFYLSLLKPSYSRVNWNENKYFNKK